MSGSKIDLLSPEHDRDGQYGRDFNDLERGVGRIVVKESRLDDSTARVVFYGLDEQPRPWFTGSSVELIDAVTDNDTATAMIEGMKYAMRELGN